MRVSTFHTNQIPSNLMSVSQLETDALVASLSEQATNSRNLLAMSAGSAAFSAFQLGFNSLLSFVPGARALSWSAALVGEVGVFRGINETSSWRESNGFIQTMVDFTCLKLVGHGFQSHHFITRHTISALGMMAGGYTSEALRLLPGNSKNFSERFAHAYASSISMEAGARLFRMMNGKVFDRLSSEMEQSNQMSHSRNYKNSLNISSELTVMSRNLEFERVSDEEVRRLGDYVYDAKEISDDVTLLSKCVLMPEHIIYEEGMLRLNGDLGIIGKLFKEQSFPGNKPRNQYDLLVERGHWYIYEKLGFRILSGDRIFVPSINSLNRRLAELGCFFRLRPVLGLAKNAMILEGMKKIPPEFPISTQGIGFIGQSFFNHDLFFHLGKYFLMESNWPAYSFLFQNFAALERHLSSVQLARLYACEDANAYVTLMPDALDRDYNLEEIYPPIRLKLRSSFHARLLDLDYEQWKAWVEECFPEEWSEVENFRRAIESENLD